MNPNVISMTSAQIPTVTLPGNVRMPQVSFGVWQIPAGQATAVVAQALRAGHRGIDNAPTYDNEAEVGRALAESGLSRESMFVATKLWSANHRRDLARRAFEESLRRLRLEYVDLFLIHWPVPAQDRYAEAWRTLVELRDEGMVRAIGVANFNRDHLERVIEATGVVPAVNQIELHPEFPQRALRGYHAERGIVTQAWSPLAQAWGRRPGAGPLAHPAIVGLADAYRKTPAQIVLRWHLQLGNAIVTKSVDPRRMAEGLGISDIELDRDAMRAIARLETGTRLGPNPATNNVID